MRITTDLLIFSAVCRANTRAKYDPIEHYQLSQEELQTFLITQRMGENSRASLEHVMDPPIPPDADFINMEALCEGFDKKDHGRNWEYKYRFARARCQPDHGDRRAYDLTCTVTIKKASFYAFSTVSESTFRYVCDEHYVCQNWDYTSMDFVRKQDIMCVPESEVNTEHVHVAEAVPGTPTKGELHCTRAQLVPSSPHYATSKGINFVVTEEVLWLNGSAYPAPILLIHDKSSPFSFDRVLKKGASVASADMTLGPAGPNRIQQRKLQFCVELLPGRRDFWVIFMYSWWRSAGRRSRIPTIGSSFRSHEGCVQDDATCPSLVNF